jgi:hypothetical protein
LHPHWSYVYAFGLGKVGPNISQAATLTATPSVPLNFKELGFLAGIKGCVNFNMTNPVTKKIF